MSKVKISETRKDTFRQTIGSAPVVNQSFTSSKLEFTQDTTFNVEINSTKPSSRDGINGEEVELFIRPNGNPAQFVTNLRSVVSENTDFTDHFCEFITPTDNDLIKELPATQGISTYDINVKFDYISEDYDNFQDVLEETNLPIIFQDKRKQDFIGFKRENKPAPIELNPSESRKFQNVIFPTKPNPNSNYKREPTEFPYYNQLSISSNTKTNFTDFLNKTDTFYFLLNDYVNTTSPPLSFDVQSDGLVMPKDIPVFSLKAWADGASFEISDNVFIAEETSPVNSRMKNNFKKLLFIGYYNTLAQNFRNFESLMNRELCYNEEVAYTFDKYKDFAIDPKVQRLLMPSVENRSVINDTQVKYGQTYVYVCNGHYVIVGNTYRYENLKFHNRGTDEEYASLTVKNYPSVVLVPLSYFQKTVKIVQPPPVFPQVKFFTENNSEKQIQVYLSPTKGEKVEKFIPILDTDNQLEIDLSLYYKDTEKITFQTFEEDGRYEIFRTDSAPKSYDDFSESKIGEVNIKIASTDALFVDDVIPSKKYYYCFRKLNSKGLVSNPTTIYEVELIIDADDSKLNVEKYKIPEQVLSNDSRSFARLFQITPAVEQTIFNRNQNEVVGKTSLKGTIDNLKLGVARESLWGKKLKFRVKSNVTGKIIDYNIDFTLTKNKTEEDF
jgi:hypothetical protein